MKRSFFDLNCDLGEGEPLARTRALMQYITSANVACGGHAGDVRTMRQCVRLARQHGVRLGAHPGPWSRQDFGRQSVRLSPDPFEWLLLQQVGALSAIARHEGVALHHVKLHGALYHASDNDPRLARRYVEAMRRYWPGCIVYARAGGRVARFARARDVPVWEEAFADRGYEADGRLVDRRQPGALLTETGDVIDRVRRLTGQGEIIAVTGTAVRLTAQTICVHGDTPHAVRLAKAVSETLGV